MLLLGKKNQLDALGFCLCHDGDIRLLHVCTHTQTNENPKSHQLSPPHFSRNVTMFHRNPWGFSVLHLQPNRINKTLDEAIICFYSHIIKPNVLNLSKNTSSVSMRVIKKWKITITPGSVLMSWNIYFKNWKNKNKPTNIVLVYHTKI